jgi:hypothetical protein
MRSFAADLVAAKTYAINAHSQAVCLTQTDNQKCVCSGQTSHRIKYLEAVALNHQIIEISLYFH